MASETEAQVSRVTPEQWLLRNLAGDIASDRRAYMTKEQAYAELKQWTGQDLGYDVQKWRDWFKAHRHELKRGIVPR
jgi:hypothetical protein